MPKGSLRVLVVDDERPIADSLTLILQSAGYDVRKAYSGEAGVVLERAKSVRVHSGSAAIAATSS